MRARRGPRNSCRRSSPTEGGRRRPAFRQTPTALNSTSRDGRRSAAAQPMRESPAMPDQLTITRPDDWHLHVRDGAALAAVVPASARQFGRAIVMPNLKPPVTTTAAALAYRDRIRRAVPAGVAFEPLMT